LTNRIGEVADEAEGQINPLARFSTMYVQSASFSISVRE